MDEKQIEPSPSANKNDDLLPSISPMALKRNIWLEQDDLGSRNRKQQVQEVRISGTNSRNNNDDDLVGSAVAGTGVTQPRTKKKRKLFVHSLINMDPTIDEDGTYMCPMCHTSRFGTAGALESHTRTCCGLPKLVQGVESSSHPVNPFGFIPDHEPIQEEAAKLSDFNQLTLAALDMYEIQASDLPLPRRQRIQVQPGCIAIRCRYCAAKKADGVGCILFPGSLDLLCIIVYRIRDRHFLGTECPHIPSAVRSKMRSMKSRSKTKNKGDIGLPRYMKAVAQHYSLVENPNGNGIRRNARTLGPEK